VDIPNILTVTLCMAGQLQRQYSRGDLEGMERVAARLSVAAAELRALAYLEQHPHILKPLAVPA
jgi:hypothetical protein